MLTAKAGNLRREPDRGQRRAGERLAQFDTAMTVAKQAEKNGF
jgi:hypothetical protein